MTVNLFLPFLQAMKLFANSNVVGDTATGVHLDGTSYGKGRYTFNELGAEL